MRVLIRRGVLIAAMAALVLAVGHAAYGFLQGGGGFLIGGGERQRVPVARDIPLPEELEPLGAMASPNDARRTIHRFGSSQSPAQILNALGGRMTRAGWQCRRVSLLGTATGAGMLSCSNAARDSCRIHVSPDERGGSVVNIVRAPRAPVSK